MLIVVGLLAGLGLLFIGGDWLVKGASRLAQSLGISPLMVGLTVVAIGTSAPELLVSVGAALNGAADLAVGNIVGSNIANIGLILGICGLIYPIGVQATLLRREIPILLLVAVSAVVLVQDGQVSRLDGIMLLLGLLVFNLVIIWSSRAEAEAQPEAEDPRTKPAPVGRYRELARLLIGIVLLMVGAQLTVSNATAIAQAAGISELVIGVTLVALGTSLPELVTSVTAALRRESDIAIGNVVGSNIFNVLGILSLTALIQPLPVAPQTSQVDSLVMLALSVLLLPFALDRKLGRLESSAFLLVYTAFIVYAVALI